MKTSLIISTYNSPKLLNLCLKSVLNQAVMPDEVIIADDGSQQETKDIIDGFAKECKVEVKHIWHKDSGCRKTIIMNKAVNSSIGDYILQIDGDILLHPKFVQDHILYAKEAYFVRGGRALIGEKMTLGFIAKMQYEPTVADVLKLKHRLNAFRCPVFSILYRRESKDIAHVKGCNMAYWKKDFVKINGYNNDILGWGHEDVELAARLYNSGVKMRKLKFMGIEFHLHHKFSPRDKEKENLKVFLRAVEDKTAKVENGYSQSMEIE